MMRPFRMLNTNSNGPAFYKLIASPSLYLFFSPKLIVAKSIVVNATVYIL